MLGVQKLHAASVPTTTIGTICTESNHCTQAAGSFLCPRSGVTGSKRISQRQRLRHVRSEAVDSSTRWKRGSRSRVVLESAFFGMGVVDASRGSLTNSGKRLHRSCVKAFAKNPPAVETTTDSPVLRTLYPSSASHKQGYVKVSDLHTIYYEVFGNKNGKPAVFLHGGPGAGCTANHSRFFDPERYRIVLFDQRGCGKSTPRGCLEENDARALVEDLEKLRTELEIDRWLVVGGSWGTTLALAYAQTHPQRVSAMVLRAVCMMRQREIDWFYKQGADALFPFAWDQYVAHIPEEERGDLLRAYYRRLTSDDRQTADAAARSWLRWEMSLLSFSNVPVVISWDGKEFKTLPMPVAAASPASASGPANGPNPASSSGVSAKVSSQPPSPPSSNGSIPGQAGVKTAVTETNQRTETTSTSQQQRGSAASTENGNGNGRESVTAASASSGVSETDSRNGNGTRNGNGSGSVSENGGKNGNTLETENNTGKGARNGNGTGAGNGSRNGGVQEGSSTGRGTSKAAQSDGSGVGRTPSAETMLGGDWVSSSLAQARLESHYSINRAFLSEDQLLKGVDRIRKIPTVAIQGRYDFVCPMKTAFDLHSAWPEMELRVVPNAGHSQYEPGITHEIITATDRFKDLD